MSSINEKINYIAKTYYKDNNSLFAKAMGTSETNIRNYRKSTAPKLDFIIKLRDALEISFDYLLEDEQNVSNIFAEPKSVYTLKTDKKIDHQKVPLYDIEATAGVVGLFKNDKKLNSQPIDFITIPNLPKCDGAIYVTGDSMYPLLKSGDIIMYKELNNSIESIFFGEMYLLSIDLDGDEYITVKWIHKSEKGEEYIKIVSQNSHHQPKDVHIQSIKALALIKASIRINSMS